MSEERKDTAVETESVTQPDSIHNLERKMKLKGTVERLELYGAFIDVGLETNALVHISKVGDGHVNRVSDVLNVGDEVEVWVEKVDPEHSQIMVSMVEPVAVEWSDLKEGKTFTGRVTRLENFGAFVDIGAEREGLVHISELSHDYVKHPSEVVNVGDDVEVQVIGSSRRKRRIDLSMKALMEKPEDTSVATSRDIEELQEEPEDMPTAMEIAMRRAMSKHEGANGKDSKKSRQKKQKDAREDILSRTLKLRD
ncbi:MAG: S1 RNA-binding domain-containing protein [Chloroflexota bacterium]